MHFAWDWMIYGSPSLRLSSLTWLAENGERLFRAFRVS